MQAHVNKVLQGKCSIWVLGGNDLALKTVPTPASACGEVFVCVVREKSKILDSLLISENVSVRFSYLVAGLEGI
jgi:hypothetical protein